MAQDWVFDHVVVGASDLAGTAAFFALHGFDPVATRVLGTAEADRYGLPAGVEEVVLGVEGAAGGRVRLIASPLEPDAYSLYAPRAEALDVYSRDVRGSVAEAEGAGYEAAGPVADYAFGPMRLIQAMVHGPDEVALVYVDLDPTTFRLPSVLDAEPERRHSELHSVVCVVDDLEAATAFFQDVAGLSLRATFPLTEPAVSRFMGLPRESTMRMSVLSAEDAAPPRFELLQFDGEPADPRASLPLRPGGLLPVFTTPDLDAAAGLLDGARLLAGAVVGRTPGGVEVEVRGR